MSEKKVKFDRTAAIFGAILPILGIVSAVALYFGFTKTYDYEIRHFEYSSPWFYISTAALMLSAVLSVIFAVSAGKKVSVTAQPKMNAHSSVASVLMFVTGGFAIVPTLRSIRYSGIANSKAMLAFGICVLFLAFAAIFSSLPSIRATAIHSFAAAVGSCAPVILLFIRYFNFDLPLNSPERNIEVIMLSALALFVLSEARLSFGVPNRLITSGFEVLALSFCASAGLGTSAVLLALKLLRPADFPDSAEIYYSALCLAASVLALQRLFTLSSMTGDAPPHTEEIPEKTDSASTEEN